MSIETEWHDCTLCGDEYPQARHDLGYRTCLVCGEKVAKQEAAAKQLAVVAMPKSNLVYLGQGSSALEAFKTVQQGSRGGQSS
jgi:ribosomal protein L37AE/L43A